MACSAVEHDQYPARPLSRGPARESVAAPLCGRRLGRGQLARSRIGVGHIRKGRSEEHTSELQSLMRISYAVFCLKKKNKDQNTYLNQQNNMLQRRIICKT